MDTIYYVKTFKEFYIEKELEEAWYDGIKSGLQKGAMLGALAATPFSANVYGAEPTSVVKSQTKVLGQFKSKVNGNVEVLKVIKNGQEYILFKPSTPKLDNAKLLAEVKKYFGPEVEVWLKSHGYNLEWEFQHVASPQGVYIGAYALIPQK